MLIDAAVTFENVPAGQLTHEVWTLWPVRDENVPGEQDVHEVAPYNKDQVPAWQEVHDTAPDAENVPLLHCEQIAALVAPRALENSPALQLRQDVARFRNDQVPATHWVHAVLPEIDENVPDEQFTQEAGETWPRRLLAVPAGQCWQTEAIVAPTRDDHIPIPHWTQAELLKYVPATQPVQVEEPTVEVVPGEQVEQVLDRAEEYEPALQLVHEEAPAAENVPALQLKHNADEPEVDQVPATQILQEIAAASKYSPTRHFTRMPKLTTLPEVTSHPLCPVLSITPQEMSLEQVIPNWPFVRKAWELKSLHQLSHAFQQFPPEPKNWRENQLKLRWTKTFAEQMKKETKPTQDQKQEKLIKN